MAGQPIVHELLKSGHQVRALVRDINRAAPLAAAGVDAMGVSVDTGGHRSLDGHELAGCFSEGLGRPIRYESLDLDEFERGIDQALGPGVGKRVSGIFRFVQGHPDDLEFISKPFIQPPGVPHFESTDVAKWVAAHSKDFAALAAAG